MQVAGRILGEYYSVVIRRSFQVDGTILPLTLKFKVESLKLTLLMD